MLLPDLCFTKSIKLLHLHPPASHKHPILLPGPWEHYWPWWSWPGILHPGSLNLILAWSCPILTPPDAVGVLVFSPISGPDSVGSSSPEQAPQPCFVSSPTSSCLWWKPWPVPSLGSLLHRSPVGCHFSLSLAALLAHPTQTMQDGAYQKDCDLTAC